MLHKLDKKKWYSFKLFLFVLPFIVLVLLFSYYPLYGWLYAFYDYRPPRPFSEAEFVGLKWFKSLVENPIKIAQLWQVLKNTFVMSGITLGTSWIPMLFAVFLNEIHCVPFRKFVPTLPNFISWVLVYSVAFSFFNSTGMVNSFLMSTGLTKEPILFLQSSDNVWLTQWLWLTWKNLGWAAIMYIAAISSIDGELFQAAKVDGATRMQMIRYIMEQYYVFQNAFNKEYIQVLDLYVYNLAMGSGSYSVSVALSMLKSIVSVILLIVANTVSKVTRGESFL